MIGDLCHLYFNEMNCDDLLLFFFSFIYVFCIHCTYRMNVYYQKLDSINYKKHNKNTYYTKKFKILSTK